METATSVVVTVRLLAVSKPGQECVEERKKAEVVERITSYKEYSAGRQSCVSLPSPLPSSRRMFL